MRLSENMKGALLMCASMAGFAFNDAAIKYASAPIGIYQSIFIRGVFAVLFIGVAVWISKAYLNLPTRKDWKLIFWRTIAEIGATMCFLVALFNMPIANITAILQALPLTVTLAASVFLGEVIGTRRLIAILIGFIGVMLIIQPGTEGFNSYSILGILATLFVTWRDIIVRRFSKELPSVLVAFITAISITAMGLVMTVAYEGWTPAGSQTYVLLAFAGLMIFGGYYFAVATMRHGEIGFVTPFRYTIMIWAILLGYFVFGDVPNNMVLAGVAIVILMGLYTFWREQRLARRD